MNDHQVKGKVKNLKGRVKEAAGAIAGDRELEGEGAADRLKGAAQETYGDAKEALTGEKRRVQDETPEDDV